MLDATATLTPDDGAAEGLTESYNRIRTQAVAVVKSTALPFDEFEAPFPPIERAQMPGNITQAAVESPRLESDAKRANLLLRQMAGWFDGVVQAITLERRLVLEARERVARESKPQTGFTSASQ